MRVGGVVHSIIEVEAMEIKCWLPGNTIRFKVYDQLH